MIEHIAMTNLRSLDLNLLVAFEALMAERSVSRAARRIGLSQPAMSGALARLRSLFDDQLLVRGDGQMRPTPRAESLEGPVREALALIRSSLAAAESFDPAIARRGFTLAMSSFAASVCLPILVPRVEAEAPGIDIRVRGIEDGDMTEPLTSGAADVAVCYCPKLPSQLMGEPIVTERFVSAVCRDNPEVGERLTLERYVALNHLLVSPKGDPVGKVDHLLARHGLRRRVAVTVPSFLVVPFVLPGTRLVATLAARAVSGIAGQRLKVVEPPLEMTGFEVHMVWDRSRDRDPALIWLRDQLRAAAAES